jgi:hypothetical protein
MLLFLIFFFRVYCFDDYFIVINSVPKCGTNLLAKAISLITWKEAHYYDLSGNYNSLYEYNKNNLIYCSHLFYRDYKQLCSFFDFNKLKIFLIVRDPRDFVVSFAYHVKKNQDFYDADYKAKSKNINELIDFILDNKLIELYYKECYFDWLGKIETLNLKFEDLVGIHGGGSELQQKNILKKIYSFLDISCSEVEIINIQNNLFGNSATFREGKIGSWKNEFTEQQIKEFNLKYTWLLKLLHY